MIDPMEHLRRFPPTTVRIGGMTKTELLGALRAQNVRLNEAATALFQDGRWMPLDQRRVVEIAVLSVAELGFSAGAIYAHLIARALESKLAECPLELGPHLRLQFLQQDDIVGHRAKTHAGAPAGSFAVASTPLDDTDETPKGFYLRRVDGVLWLRGYWCSSDHVFSPTDVFVFSRTAAA